MPFASFKFPQGLLNEKQKEEIIHKTTDMFASYFGEGVRPYADAFGAYTTVRL